jgi:hypothetical protein
MLELLATKHNPSLVRIGDVLFSSMQQVGGFDIFIQVIKRCGVIGPMRELKVGYLCAN